MKKLISAAVVAISFGFTPYVHASYMPEHCDNDESGTLSTREYKNRSLEGGEYEFAQLHSKADNSFNDLWGFSLDEDSTVSISVFDLEQSMNFGSSALKQLGQHDGSWRGKKHAYMTHHDSSSYWPNSGKLLDNKFMSFSLFDEDGNLIGSAGENGTLSNLALLGGEWYTLSVSAAVKGLFGSAYRGTLNVNSDVTPAAVPLGDSLPFFAASLGVLGLRYRKNLKLQR